MLCSYGRSASNRNPTKLVGMFDRVESALASGDIDGERLTHDPGDNNPDSTAATFKALKCECGEEYELKASHVCEFCFGPLEVTYDYDALRRTVTRESIQDRIQFGATVPSTCRH